jgi:DNA polymerase III subunit delta'
MAFLSEEALNRLESAHQDGRLAHAYLISGSDLPALENFVFALSGTILGCKSTAVAAHPDFHLLRPESKSRRILIDQIRDLERVLHQSAAVARGSRVAVFLEADRLVEAGANAFLKTLEEPLPGTHIFLVSALPDSMLSTIRSRCIDVPLRTTEKRTPSPREMEVRQLASQLLDPSHPPNLPEVFIAVRKFRELLADAREEATKEADTLLKEQKKHYQDRTEAGAKWVEEQEGILAARGEGSVLRERARLLDSLAAVLAERLKLAVSAGDRRIGRSEALRLIRQYEAVGRLRSSLDRNLNEGLALEAGFLEIFLQA